MNALSTGSRGRRAARRLTAVLAFAGLALAAAACSSSSGPTSPRLIDVGDNDPRVVVGFGDSITHGRHGDIRGVDSAIGGYIPTLEGLLEVDGRDIDVREEGDPGTDTNDGVVRIDRVLEAHRPAVILILYGTNDEYDGIPKAVVREKSVTISNLAFMVDRALAGQTLPVLATVPPACGVQEFLAPDIQELNELILALARDRNVPLADVYGAFLETGGCDLIGLSGVHPTDDGYRLIASVFHKVLRNLHWGEP